MLNRVAAPSLATRPYFHRYTDDAVDLCDVLSSYGSSTKASLQEISRSLGLPGKTDGMKGSEVETLFNGGQMSKVAEYCRGDVINTYHIWLTYELFCGRLTPEAYARSYAPVNKASEIRAFEHTTSP
jgi:predicted PolB exonuclease-like 3'-5' exonuclease